MRIEFWRKLLPRGVRRCDACDRAIRPAVVELTIGWGKGIGRKVIREARCMEHYWGRPL